MLVAVKQECLDNPEMLKRIKLMELLGDKMVMMAREGDISLALEKMDSAGVDWDIVNDEQRYGWDILFGTTKGSQEYE
jgi:hypothetical protein